MKNETYKLADSTIMAIAPEYGCNMFSWVVNGHENLYCPDDFWGGSENFFAGGNPIIYPSVGRTWDRSGSKPNADVYRINDMNGIYQMPIHGIVPLGTWRKRWEKIADDCIQVEYAFSVPEEVLAAHYPFDIFFRLCYTLTSTNVKIEAFFENKGNSSAPLAFGCHPYFRITDKNSIKLSLPCKNRVLLDPELLIPAGKETLASSILSLEKDKVYDMAFDNMNGNRASIIDRKAGHQIHVDFDENIEMFVIYSDSNCEYVCMEPWTKGLGAYEILRHDSWQDTKQLCILHPQETKTVRIQYSIAATTEGPFNK